MIRIPTTPKKECPDCFPGSVYCPVCGEKKLSPGDYSVKKFFSDIFEDLTNIDAKFFKTLYLLTFRPGFLSLEYSRGVHAHYIKPLRLFVLIALVHFLAFGLISSVDMYNLDSVHFLDRFGFYDRIIQSAYLKELNPVYTDTASINKEIKNILSIAIYGVIFFVAALFYLMFRKRKTYYTEHLVFIFHIISAAFLRNLILIPAFFIYKPLGFFLAAALNFIYVLLAIKNFYSVSLPRAAITLIPILATLFVMTYITLISSAVLAMYF
ncbi:MAG TPA: DUF3667 domain-containing protein [Cyclobacteriaceae bacterium]|nr:DUF3667 domain-containing protein [Cyclobacteriaceae bacterium]